MLWAIHPNLLNTGVKWINRASSGMCPRPSPAGLGHGWAGRARPGPGRAWVQLGQAGPGRFVLTDVLDRLIDRLVDWPSGSLFTSSPHTPLHPPIAHSLWLHLPMGWPSPRIPLCTADSSCPLPSPHTPIPPSPHPRPHPHHPLALGMGSGVWQAFGAD